jgi:GNAT superfamily N-acetyltransferase
MQLQIERADLADVPAIMDLIHLCTAQMRAQGIGQWDDEYPSFAIIEDDAKTRSLFKALVGDQLVGTVSLNDKQPDQYKPLVWRAKAGNALVVRRLCVHPEWRKQRVGASLLKFAEDYARQQKLASVRLDAYTGNPRAVSLYNTNGYHCVGQAEFRNRPLPFDCFEKVIE